jgi:hypothetical protein
VRQEPMSDEGADPTPGEMLLRALGALWLRWRLEPKGSIPPHRLDVEAVALVIGVEVEHFQEGELDDKDVLFLHLPGEVLVIDYRQEFPWKLLDVRAWGRRQEWHDLWRRAA